MCTVIPQISSLIKYLPTKQKRCESLMENKTLTNTTETWVYLIILNEVKELVFMRCGNLTF